MNPWTHIPGQNGIINSNNGLSPDRHKIINNYVITTAADTLDAGVISTSVARALTIRDGRAIFFYDGVFNYVRENANISYEYQYKSSMTRIETRYELWFTTPLHRFRNSASNGHMVTIALTANAALKCEKGP